MKLSIVAGCAFLLSQASAFQVAPSKPQMTLTHLGMFGGAGAGAAKEDNSEESEQMDQAAKAMGMSTGEYTIAMNARAKLAETLDSTMITLGDPDTILVVRDVNNPPKKLEITITEAGKALGKEEVSTKLCAALAKSAEESRNGRTEAQKTMMDFITTQLKD